jgi:hypothetical protein
MLVFFKVRARIQVPQPISSNILIWLKEEIITGAKSSIRSHNALFDKAHGIIIKGKESKGILNSDL